MANPSVVCEVRARSTLLRGFNFSGIFLHQPRQLAHQKSRRSSKGSPYSEQISLKIRNFARLQRVQNTLARVLLRKRKFSFLTRLTSSRRAQNYNCFIYTYFFQRFSLIFCLAACKAKPASGYASFKSRLRYVLSSYRIVAYQSCSRLESTARRQSTVRSYELPAPITH